MRYLITDGGLGTGTHNYFVEQRSTRGLQRRVEFSARLLGRTIWAQPAPKNGSWDKDISKAVAISVV